MEKTEEFSVPAAAYSSQRPQPNIATTNENRGPSHVRMFPHNKASHVVNPSGSFQSASPLVHGTTACSLPLPYQLPTSEVRPVISSGVVSGNPVRDSSLVALPRGDRPSFRMDGRPNGSSHMLQVQGNKNTFLPASKSAQRFVMDLFFDFPYGGLLSKLIVDISMEVPCG